MKKRWAAALLAALLLVQLMGVPTQATENIYFLGTEENIQPVSDSTMPFWHNNYLYIPSSVFVGTTRAALKVGCSQASDGSWVALYKDGTALLFREGLNYAEDTAGRILYPGAVKKNGQYFVPVSLLAGTFGLDYSVSKVDHGWLVWLRNKNFILSESQFTDAATNILELRYEEYMSAKAPPSAAAPAPTPPQTPVTISGKQIYLCFRAGDLTDTYLDLLDRYHAKATVYCTAEFMTGHHDLLRRITASGHGIGLLADAERTDLSVLEQLSAANRELDRAAGEMTRLVRVEHGDDALLQQLRDSGYSPELSLADRARYTLQNSQQAGQLFQSVASTPKASVLWLDDTVQAGGLIRFLTLTVEQREVCLPLTELTPVS